MLTCVGVSRSEMTHLQFFKDCTTRLWDMGVNELNTMIMRVVVTMAGITTRNTAETLDQMEHIMTQPKRHGVGPVVKAMRTRRGVVETITTSSRQKVKQDMVATQSRRQRHAYHVLLAAVIFTGLLCIPGFEWRPGAQSTVMGPVISSMGCRVVGMAIFTKPHVGCNNRHRTT